MRADLAALLRCCFFGRLRMPVIYLFANFA